MTCTCGVAGCVGTDPTVPPVTPVYVHHSAPTMEQLAETLAAAGVVRAETRATLRSDASLLDGVQAVRRGLVPQQYDGRHRTGHPADRDAS